MGWGSRKRWWGDKKILSSSVLKYYMLTIVNNSNEYFNIARL
jgi:hypothetical protein